MSINTMSPRTWQAPSIPLFFSSRSRRLPVQGGGGQGGNRFEFLFLTRENPWLRLHKA